MPNVVDTSHLKGESEGLFQEKVAIKGKQPGSGMGIPKRGEGPNGRSPFRLGTTSYILPADIIPNLRFLGGRVDDVELVLFDVDGWSNIPSLRDTAEMAQIAEDYGMTFTVHLPLDTRLGSGDEGEREDSVAKCLRVMERVEGVHPVAWILHLHGDYRGDPPTDDPGRWLAQNRRSLLELLTTTGADPRTICIETLDYDFNRVSDLVEGFDLSVCLDIGHLLLNGRDVAAHMDRWWDRIRVFHIHGVCNGDNDHTHLGHLPVGLLDGVIHRMAGLPKGDVRVLTIEVFGRDDFERSMDILKERLISREVCSDLPQMRRIVPEKSQ